MKKDNDRIWNMMLLLLCLFSLYGIYKYGFVGYVNKRMERRQNINQNIARQFM